MNSLSWSASLGRRCRRLPPRFSCRAFRSSSPVTRLNSFGVELLPEAYQTKLFQSVRSAPLDKEAEAQALKDLGRFGLIAAGREGTPTAASETSQPASPDITSLIPPRAGRNVEEHFEMVGRELVQPYLDLLDPLLNTNIPPPPAHWQIQPGWVRLVFGRIVPGTV